jgi:hypothetical protein
VDGLTLKNVDCRQKQGERLVLRNGKDVVDE